MSLATPTSRSLVAFAVTAAVLAAARAHAQVRLADLATTSTVASSTPRDFAALGADTLFLTFGTGSGRLWATDGTSAGTRALLRTTEAPVSILGTALVPSGGIALFCFGRRDSAGYGLFRTDGTILGTYELTSPDGVKPSSSALPMLHAGIHYFAGRRADVGDELWRSDGTIAGTALVADVYPGASSSSPRMLTSTSRGLFFIARGSTGVDQLWISDGTTAGTASVPGVSYPQSLTGTTNGVLFTMWGGAAGRELWFSDGTAAGTAMVADLSPGAASSSVYDRGVPLGSSAVLYLNTAATGFEPWISDGTAAGTFQLADVMPGPPSSMPATSLPYLVSSGTRAYFAADDGAHGTEIWTTDGTVLGTRMLADVEPGAIGSVPQALAIAGTGVVFRATTSASGSEPWVSDGTTAGTRLIADVIPGTTGSSPDSIARIGSRYYFAATVNGTGSEPWVSDGAGTRMLADLGIAAADSSPSDFVAAGTRTVFRADPGTGFEAVGTDGSAAGTQVLDLGAGAADPAEFVSFQNFAWFAATSPSTGRELFRSDGTLAGTALFTNIAAGSASSSPRGLAVIGNRLYFSATTATMGFEPFVSDGTVAGTFRLGDLAPSISSSFPSQFTACGAIVVFFADDVSPGLELFRTDGTVLGTSIFADLEPTNGAIAGAELRAFGNAAVFVVRNHTTYGSEVWRTDGTYFGTNPIADLSPGPSGSDPRDLVVTGDGRLFFVADSGSGRELHVSDGTTPGTRMVVDLAPSGSAPITRLVAGFSRVFFAMTDMLGTELWTSDGTAAGTRLLREANIGPGTGLGTAPFAALPGYAGIVFAGYHPVDQLQVWVSDGSVFGTHPVGQLTTAIGPGAARMTNLRVAGNAAWFAADDGAFGLEPWSADLDARRAFQSTYGTGCAGSSGFPPSIGAPVLPRLGDTNFRIELTRALPWAGAVVLVGFAGMPPASCGLLIAPPLVAGPTQLTSGAGIASLTLGIPNQPSIAGAELFAQWAVIDPAGTFLPGIAVSDGLQFRVGLP